jgi:predicted transcriptional regulator
LLSKAELARKAGVSSLTIDRVERGEACRLETMRKIILALGYSLEEKEKVFQD